MPEVLHYVPSIPVEPHLDRRFILCVRQQPVQARLSSNNERDRRPVDPVPIIQITFDSAVDNGEKQEFLQSTNYFMSARLVAANTDMTPPAPMTLSGSVVSSLYHLKDVDDRDGAFFVFGDLSVKQEGMFRLQFDLFEMSTSFADQGVRMRIRKENRTHATSKKRKQVSDSEDDASVNRDATPARQHVSRVSPARKQEEAEYGLPSMPMIATTTAAQAPTPPPAKEDGVRIHRLRKQPAPMQVDVPTPMSGRRAPLANILDQPIGAIPPSSSSMLPRPLAPAFSTLQLPSQPIPLALQAICPDIEYDWQRLPPFWFQLASLNRRNAIYATHKCHQCGTSMTLVSTHICPKDTHRDDLCMDPECPNFYSMRRERPRKTVVTTKSPTLTILHHDYKVSGEKTVSMEKETKSYQLPCEACTCSFNMDVDSPSGFRPPTCVPPVVASTLEREMYHLNPERGPGNNFPADFDSGWKRYSKESD
ncbi:hypothetical protein BZG36_01263, partial [Bifiguratus adelaidae]